MVHAKPVKSLGGARSGLVWLSNREEATQQAGRLRDEARKMRVGKTREASDKTKREMFDRLHRHFNRLADEVEKAIAASKLKA